jgi:hypothetical protein
MTRTTRKTVIFLHPFTLKGVGGTLSPGEYQVITDDGAAALGFGAAAAA